MNNGDDSLASDLGHVSIFEAGAMSAFGETEAEPLAVLDTAVERLKERLYAADSIVFWAPAACPSPTPLAAI